MPSLVSISPPNPSNLIVSPTAIFDALDAPLVLGAGAGATAATALLTVFATAPFFFAGGAATGSAGAFLFLNSGGMAQDLDCWMRSLECCAIGACDWRL